MGRTVDCGMATYLLKTEPSEYSFDDLVRDNRAVWDGVNNGLAQQFMRAARPRDDVLIYHTGNEKQIVGMAELASEAYEDPKRPGLNARGEIKNPVFDVVPVKRALTPVPLEAIKKDTRFADFLLIRQPRLSVMLVPDEMAFALKELAGLLRTPAGRGSRGLGKVVKPSR